jgi:hypothetical protein
MIAKYLLIGIAVLFTVGTLPTSSYAQIAPNTIAGMWLFDEGKGDTAKDTSGNGNDGTILGPEWVNEGKIGKALKFDGSDDYVDCGNGPSLDLTDQITFVAWVNHPPGTEGYVIIRNIPDDSIRQWGFLDYVSTGNISFFCDTGAGREQLDWSGTIDDNTWHHMALTINNPDVELFIDGVSRGVRKLNDQIVSRDTTVWIGRRKPSNFPYTGLLDEIAVFNVALSRDDIIRVMDEGLAKVATAVAPSGRITTTWASVKKQ